jgi:hypothetical protein
VTTAADLIKTAAQKLGAIESGASLTAEEANDGLNVLNSMLDALSIERRYIYQIQQESFTWTAAATSKTIGASGDFNTTRPERIEEGTFFRDSNNNDYPVMVAENREVYDRITVKSVTSTYPQILFYDKAYPLGVLYVYPVPSGALTLKLNSWKILQSFTALTTAISLPKGYQWMIENNLAIALEPVFQLTAPDSVVRAANKSLAALSRHNSPSMIAAIEATSAIGSTGHYDIFADG